MSKKAATRLSTALIVAVMVTLAVMVTGVFFLREAMMAGTRQAARYANASVSLVEARHALREKHAAARSHVVSATREELDRAIAARTEGLRHLSSLVSDATAEEHRLLAEIERLERAQHERIVDVFIWRQAHRGASAVEVSHRFASLVGPEAARLERAAEDYLQYLTRAWESARATARHASNYALLLLVGGSALAIAATALLGLLVPRTYARLYEQERSSRDQAEEARQRLQIVARAGSLLWGAQPLERSLQAVARLLVPTVADWCVIAIRGADVCPSTISWHQDPIKLPLLDKLFSSDARGGAPFGPAAVIASGEPELLCEVTDDMLVAMTGDAASAQRARDLGVSSLVVSPLATPEGMVGTLCLGRSLQRRRLGPSEAWIAEDVAHRIAAAVQTTRARVLAQRAAASRDELLATVSHDLKSPISAVRLNAVLLMRSRPNEEIPARTRKCAVAIEHATRRMDRLVSSLLDVASIEANCLSVERHPLRADELIAAACELAEPSAGEKGIDLRMSAPQQDLLVSADRDRILQVFSNLLDNALKFTPHGGAVRVAAERADREVVFSVSDTGPGLPPGDPRQLFERHACAARSAGGGTGLGLHISRGILEAHGGRIWASSNDNGGATFSFALSFAGFAARGGGDADPSQRELLAG